MQVAANKQGGGKAMKKIVVVLISIALIAGGCSTIKEHKKTAIGTVAGAAVGAGVGAAIGGGKGAGIGAAVGALAGGAIGYMFEKQEREFKQALADSEDASIKREQRVLEDATNEAARRDVEVLVLTFQGDVWFDTGSAALKPGAYTEIDRVAAILNRYPETSIRIEGHTDSTGSESFNQDLSEKRAMAVKNALLSKNVSETRLQTIGYGESKPVAGNDTEGGRQLNRRVEIVIVPPAQQTQPPA
jgi:outer membrane protein OmpA-like peptidoglycan-associated protein